MKFGSVCSGIEAASVAWEPLGWSPAWFSEIERFPSAVLGERWPGVPNHGDFTRIGKDVDVDAIDLLAGGTPCQSFSVAGKRLGLDDPRGNLTLEFIALAGRLRPRWVVWENVPGVLSDDGGRTFGTVLGLLGKLGYGLAYRVLNAQHFGVPQRRRRVFVVGHLGAWQPAAAVLLEPSCMRGDPPPRREAREGTTGPIAGCANGGGANGPGRTADDADSLVAFQNTGQGWWNQAPVAQAIRTPEGGGSMEANVVAHALRADGFDASEDGTGRGTPIVPESSPAIKARDWRGPSSDGDGDGAILVPLAFDTTQMTSAENRSNPKAGDPCHPLAAGAHAPAVAFDWQSGGDSRGQDPKETAQLQRCQVPATHSPGMAVRRLTPRECERLQGFPDNYTAITYRGKPAADGPRYRALGNSMAVCVMAWIGRRILSVVEPEGVSK